MFKHVDQDASEVPKLEVPAALPLRGALPLPEGLLSEAPLPEVRVPADLLPEGPLPEEKEVPSLESPTATIQCSSPTECPLPAEPAVLDHA
ncbi:MAG: hypothetical protein ACKO96_48995, partial [Flammeovirgaceae bacterium]